jgi:hypothetical protein
MTKGSPYLLLDFAERTIKEFNYDQLLWSYQRNEDAKLVAIIPGIGYYTALTIVAEYDNYLKVQGFRCGCFLWWVGT